MRLHNTLRTKSHASVPDSPHGSSDGGEASTPASSSGHSIGGGVPMPASGFCDAENGGENVQPARTKDAPKRGQYGPFDPRLMMILRSRGWSRTAAPIGQRRPASSERDAGARRAAQA